MSTHPSTSTTRTAGRTVPQWLALVIGAVFTLIGLAGFAVTGFDGFAEHQPDQTLLGFAVNPLHNIVHLLLGIVGIVMSRREGSARGYGWLLVVGYGAVLVYGLVVSGQEDGNFLNINSADNVLHGLTVLAGLATALWPRDKHRDDSAADLPVRSDRSGPAVT